MRGVELVVRVVELVVRVVDHSKVEIVGEGEKEGWSWSSEWWITRR